MVTGSDYYNVVLNKSSVQDDKNSYYKMQILEEDKSTMPR